VNAATIREAEKLIESCEHCNPTGAQIPFDNILDLFLNSAFVSNACEQKRAAC